MTTAAADVLALTMGHPSALVRAARGGPHGVRTAALDVYDLAGTDLSGVRALLFGWSVDQVHMGRLRVLVEEFVAGGGALVYCGQMVEPFVPGLSPFVPLDHRGVVDLRVRRLADHPVWHGVDPEDLTFRRGVAGFYGRGYYPDLPPGALVVHGVGPAALPLDVVYRYGAGRVLVHGGNDLWGYAEDPTTAARMTPQLLDWLLEDPVGAS